MNKEELLSYVLRHIADEANSNVNSLYFGIYPKEAKVLLEYIKDLQKKAEQGEHYKHLYSEVKKQKDDVVEYIKKEKSNYMRGCDLTKTTNTEGLILSSAVRTCDDLLRMLGETECK